MVAHTLCILLLSLACRGPTAFRTDTVNLQAEFDGEVAEAAAATGVDPAQLMGVWMNSKGEIARCGASKCIFDGSNKVHALGQRSAGSRSIVSLGTTGWYAVRASRAGVAWAKRGSRTTWWDKLPIDATSVLAEMIDTRWHNNVGETIRVLNTDKYGPVVCFGSGSSPSCKEATVKKGYVTFDNWVLIDHFLNARGNMEVHWRLLEGMSKGTKQRDVSWYTNSMKPEPSTFEGTWMNTQGEIATCYSSTGTCQFVGGRAYSMQSSGSGVLLGSTGWVAIDFDKAGVTWEKTDGLRTTWWNKLPEDPAATRRKLARVRSWSNTEGQRIVVDSYLVTFNGGSAKSLVVDGPALRMLDWVVVDLFENGNGDMEVLWRHKEDGKGKRQETVRWYQYNDDEELA